VKELRERVSYLQGLSEGLDVKGNTKEGRIINGIIEVLGDMVSSMDNLWEVHRELETYMEAIDEDLCELEGETLEDLECGDELEDMVEIACPKCREQVCFTSEVLEDDDVIEVTCPTCNEVVFINDGSFDLQPAVMGNDEDMEQGNRSNVVDI